MCSSPKIDNTAQIQAQQEADQARAREIERANQIRAGRDSVNAAFTGFDEPFYESRRKSVMDYYQPDLTQQFDDARRNLEFALARAGITYSTEAGRQQGLLARQYENATADVGRRADQAVTDTRTQVENQRATLLNQLEATADPSAASNAALARSQTLRTAPVEYSPLGDVFAGVARGVGTAIQGYRNNQLYELAKGSFGNVASPGAGSSRTVNAS